MEQINYLPFELVVDVNIKVASNYPAKKSFQTLLILAHSDDENQRNKVNEYSKYKDAVDDNATDTVKGILAVIFSQQERAKFVKVGYIDSGALVLEDELNRIANIDNNFVFLGISDEIINSDMVRGDTVAMWGNANRKITGLIDTNPDALDASKDSLTRKLMLKNYNRVFTTYCDATNKADEKNSLFAIMGYMATRNLDKPNSFYTTKFKTFSAVKATSLTITQYKNLTGFVPGQGLDKSVGNLGNVFTYVGDRTQFSEGNMASGELMSVEHALLWLEYTIKYEVMNVFSNNDVVPYTNKGVGMLVAALELALKLAVTAGIISKDSSTESYKINATDVLDVPESQRANHIAPAITWSARLAGAIHYTSIDGTLQY